MFSLLSKLDTRSRLLRAARELVVAHDTLPTAGAVAARAGVTRLTVYDHFGSLAGLMAAVADEAHHHAAAADVEGAPAEMLRRTVSAACEQWAGDPALYRRLPAAAEGPDAARMHALAEALAGADLLRPGSSLREAEDVIAVVTSFAAFDRLHHDGRRSPAAVADILLRLAGAILNQAPAYS